VKLLRSPTNLTTVLDNLERDGLVRRTASSGDRRTRPIELTPAGRERIEAALPAQAQGIRLLMAALTAAEQERLGQLCRKLGRSIAAGP
jgi:MarR family 2-MHQ and catechol resistance regulon transcriptional repressor